MIQKIENFGGGCEVPKLRVKKKKHATLNLQLIYVYVLIIKFIHDQIFIKLLLIIGGNFK